MKQYPLFLAILLLPSWLLAQQTDHSKMIASNSTNPSTTPMWPPLPLKPLKAVTPKTISPQFPGGHAGLAAYISENLILPEQTNVNQVEDFILIQFSVSALGKISHFHILKGSPINAQSVIEVLKKMPDWRPARKGGMPIESNFQIPIHVKF